MVVAPGTPKWMIDRHGRAPGRMVVGGPESWKIVVIYGLSFHLQGRSYSLNES